MDTYIGTIISTMQQLLQAENITDRFAKQVVTMGFKMPKKLELTAEDLTAQLANIAATEKRMKMKKEKTVVDLALHARQAQNLQAQNLQNAKISYRKSDAIRPECKASVRRHGIKPNAVQRAEPNAATFGWIQNVPNLSSAALEIEEFAKSARKLAKYAKQIHVPVTYVMATFVRQKQKEASIVTALQLA